MRTQQLVFILLICLALAACNKQSTEQSASQPSGIVLVKDLTNETQSTSSDLDETLSALAQNPAFSAKIIVKKNSVIAATAKREVEAKQLQGRIQIVEQ
ncbi:MAG: hypothetical protein JWL63_788 [Rhodocyclales bacterium]|nr:hypothetical protein [Rhodocyclales bacterium]